MTESLAVLLPQVMDAIGVVSKDGRNSDKGYAFRTAEDVDAAVNKAFIKLGIGWTTRVELLRLEARVYGQRDTKTNHAVVALHATLHGPAGDTLDVIGVGEGFDTTDKALNKAITAAKKYLLTTTFLIPVAGEDPDQHTMQDEPVDPAIGFGFTSTAEESEYLAAIKKLRDSLDAEQGAAYKAWREDSGIAPRPPWEKVDCDRILGELTELASRPEADSDVLEDGLDV